MFIWFKNGYFDPSVWNENIGGLVNKGLSQQYRLVN